MMKGSTGSGKASIDYAGVLLLGAAYAGIGVLSLLFAYALRFDFSLTPEFQVLFLKNVALVVPLKLVFLALFGQFGALLSYFRLPDLYRVLLALLLHALVLSVAWYFFKIDPLPPRSVILGDFVFSLLLIVGFRTVLRVARERYGEDRAFGEGSREARVAIVGAGDAGASVAADMLAKRSLRLRPVVFLDNASEKWGRQIHGIPVGGGIDDLEPLLKRFEVDKLVIALPPKALRSVQAIVEEAARLGVEAEIVPSLSELTSGQVKASRIRPVEIEDLLGREQVDLDTEGISEMLCGQVVLITGAGGSIGSELSRQIIAHNPARLLLLDRAEGQLFHLARQMKDLGQSSQFHLLIGDILDIPRMRYILQRFKPSIIFHAAAHKHVNIMEYQPCEALKNNTFGTLTLARLAHECGVRCFVLISTDKAINPTSVMGASKRLAELCIQSMSRLDGPTRFLAVRFGNVLGSSGSVIPIFRQQIADGGPVTVTHPEVTRYFMTTAEAVGLVLQSALMARGGEIFVLDMGTSIKIIDLARTMIRLSGLRPEIDIDIKIVGLQPGEKLFEEVRHVSERHLPTAHPCVLNFVACGEDPSGFEEQLESLRAEMDALERSELKTRIRGLVPEYTPFLD